MKHTRRLAALGVLTVVISCAGVVPGAAQTPPKDPPPLWDASLGASFVGTSGNSDTSTLGADASLHRRWPVWKMEATFSAVRTTDSGIQTAERYLGTVRADRRISTLLSFTAGERLEHDPLAGMDLRSVTDAGLDWALVHDTRWTLDGLTSLAVNHEQPVLGDGRNDPIAVLQAKSKIVLGPAADTTQRFTIYPDFSDSSAYRAEAEVTAQAAMNSRLALKIGYLWRRSNEPVPGFLKNDSTATASVVLRWKAATAAP
jgi:putative salt-induced outer membrane protein YdiY